MRAAWLLAGALVLSPLACGDDGAASGDAEPSSTAEPPEAPRPQWDAWAPVPWPSGDEALLGELTAAELRRDPSAEAIDTAWNHADPLWRARAAWTLGRIGGPEARQRLSDWIADGRSSIDASAVVALAFLDAPAADDGLRDVAWDELEDRLWTRYAVTEEPAEADALLLAIARIGGPRSPVRLAADLSALPSPRDEDRHAHGMDAQAILCARGYGLTAPSVDALALALRGAGARGRRAAAYALSRCAAISAELLAGQERGELVEHLAPMVADDDHEGARRAWWALEGLGELPRVVPAWILGPSDEDWMTEVAAVRALVAHADGRKVVVRRLGAMKLAAFEGPRLHVLRQLLEGLRPFAANEAELEPPLRSLRDELQAARKPAGADPARAKALTLLACEAELLLATRSGELDALRRCAAGSDRIPEHHGDRLAIEAWVHMGPVRTSEQRVEGLLELAKDPRPAVRAPALAALAGLDHPDVGPRLRDALGDEDMGVVASAAGAIGNRASDRSRRDGAAVPRLLDVVRRFENDRAIETRIAAIDALGRLARSEPKTEGEASGPSWLESGLSPLARDPAVAVRAAARRALRGRPELLESFDAAVRLAADDAPAASPVVHQALDRHPRVAGLRLHADGGTITIDATGAPAPIAQANLAALATEGFFDGLTFHRVVPGFVIQGGDPRGDGYGGPGHVMPCEWSSLRYERGTVGIALAGKDTGGSQLFVAHEAPRHLDARYTVIGRVVDGMEVVDATWPYDRITRVEVLTERPPASEPSP